MASFDPYRKWLGIPPEDQPAHHYRLLGIGLFESESDVIANAADRQMAHVRSFQSGKYAKVSQQLLNELSAARLCLLDAEKRAAYDESLKAQLAAQSTSPPAAPPATAGPPPPGAGPPPQGPPPAVGTAPVAVASAAASIGRVSTSARTYPTRRRKNNWQVPAVLLGVLFVGMLGVALMLAMDGTDSTGRPGPNPNGGRTPVDSFQLPELGRTPSPTRPDRNRPRRETPDISGTPAAQQTSTQQERPAPGPLRLGEMAAMEGHAGPVLSAAYAPDGVFVVTGGRDKTVRLWDTTGGTELRRFGGADEAVLGIGFSRDANTVYALTAPRQGAGGGNIHSWETGIGGTPKTVSLGEGRRALSFALAPDGNQAAVGCDDGTIRLIDLAEGDEVRSFSGHEGAVNCVVFSTDGNALLSGGEDGAVLAFNRNTGTEVRRFTGHEGAVRAVVVAPDGSLAVSGGDDRMVCVWDVRGNQQRAELRGHEQAVTGLAFSADGERAVSVGFDGKLIVWQVRDLREGRRFDVPGGPILAVALGAEGDRAVTASQDGIVRLWGLVAPAGDVAPDPLAGDPDPADPRTPVPDDSDVQSWTDHIRNELFQDDFQSAQGPEEKVALAETLLGRASEPRSAPDAAYAYLDLALQLAVEAGNAELALTVIDDLAERYEIDGLAMKIPHLRTFAAEARSAQDRGALVRQVLDTVDRAGRQERFDLADQLLELADSAAGSAHAQAVDGARERVAAMRKAFDDAEAARQKLEQQADDPQAALALGKYECFVKGDWQAGLPLLARGDDERLAELAETELAEPSEPHNQIALADAWWDLAESESGETQTRMRWHAATWYKQVEPNLEGAIRDQVQGRILAVGKPGTSGVPREPLPHVPDLAACRNPKTRDALLRYYGGDAETEAAVGQALEWLVRHQSTPEGYWSFDHQGPGNRNRSANPGTLDKAPNAATALALLALMGAGHSPRRGEYRRDITAGLNFLRSRMVPVGSDAGTLFEPQAGTMPSHAMAACALCEAVAMTSDTQSIRAGQAAVNFIVNTQNADGGWAYTPQLPNQKPEASNVLATAWSVQALKTAQWAGLKVPDAKMNAAEGFFDSVRDADGDGFVVEPRTSGADPAATAAALLSLMYLGWQPDRPELIRFAAAAAERGPAADGQLYRNLCTAQVLREFGGQPWATFSTAMRRQLLETQADAGPEKGSWYFNGSGWNHRPGGRLFSTAMAVLILETDYRHPPLAQQDQAGQ